MSGAESSTSRASVMLATGQLLTEDCWTSQIRAMSLDYDLRPVDHTQGHTIEDMPRGCSKPRPIAFIWSATPWEGSWPSRGAPAAGACAQFVAPRHPRFG